jgi:hypothetical protein
MLDQRHGTPLTVNLRRHSRVRDYLQLVRGPAPRCCGTRLQRQAPIVTRFREHTMTSNKRPLATTAIYRSPQNAVQRRLMLPQIRALSSALTVGY